MSIIPALGRLRQEDLQFKASLGWATECSLHNEILSQKINNKMATTKHKKTLIKIIKMN
jgi:hypothetical protein